MQKSIKLALAAVLMAALPALAQVELGDIPYQNVEPMEPSRPLWEYISGAGFIMAVLAIGFMSSRRVKDA